jgi:purine-nucleoside phosphorylase
MENNSSNLKGTQAIAAWLKEKNLSKPYAHVVLGSGIAGPIVNMKFSGWEFSGEMNFSEVPGLLVSTAPGHRASYRFYKNEKLKRVVCIQTGRLHGYEGNSAANIVKPVVVFADLGVEKFIVTNAAGSLQLKMKAGSVMVITDHFNLTGQNPLTGPNDEKIGPRFPDMSEVYSPRISKILEKNLKANKLKASRGTYICVNGPSFETPTETKLFAKWGLGAVGMSTVFETIALKHRGKEIGGFSFLANMAAGIGEKAGATLTGEEVLEEGLKKSPFMLNAIFATLEQI